jgi:hypothetical protein
MPGPLTEAQIADFHRDGYVIVPGMFDAEEMGRLISFAKGDQSLIDGATGRRDAAGNVTKLTLWNHPGDDLYGLVSRCRRLVDSAEQLLGEEVYHYHSKMMLKEPQVGGAWEWHQDYGYWYNFGCLLPNMLSSLIAVDHATRENGCLQVLKGSHRLGRVDHGKTGDQTGADPEVVEQALKRFDRVHVVAEPGDVLMFHCNLLHRSDANLSDDPRWSLICCYNAASNSPYKPSRHADYAPLMKVPDSAIKQWGHEQWGHEGESA